MRSFPIAFALVGAVVAQSSLLINTPAALVECEPVQITYSGGTPPYFVSVIPGGESTAAALLQFTETSATSITWTVNITSGTSVSLEIRDSTGTTEFDSPVTIQSGTTDSCLSGTAATTSASGATTTTSSASASASATTSSSSGAATTTTVTTATTTKASTTSSASASASTSASSSSSATGTSSSSAASTSASAASGSSSGAQSLAAPLAVVLGLFAFLA